MNILGIHIGHDSSISLVVDGEVKVSVEEERFTREKNHRGFPFGGLEYLTSFSGLSIGDMDKVVFSGSDIYSELSYFMLKSRLTTNKYLKKVYKVLSRLGIKSQATDNIKKNLLIKFMLSLGVKKDSIVFEDHHLLHAASAYLQSPFDDCLIVTSDGKGDSQSSTIYTYDGQFNLKASIDACSSVGQMYSAITMYLGFKPNRHEGKITGLAAYGNEKVFGDDLVSLFDFNDETGIYCSNIAKEVSSMRVDEIFEGFNHPLLPQSRILNIAHDNDRNYELAFVLYLKKFDELFIDATKEDVAAAAQYALEHLIVKYIKYWAEKLDKQYVCMAGGVFANVKLNQRVLNLDKVENVFIQPAMGDSGLSLGGALLYSSDSFNVKRTIDTVYKGPGFTSSEIEQKLKDSNLKYIKFSNIQEQAKYIAKKIDNNKLVGLFNGRMEFGPRALGGRTVMISAKNKTINDIANKRFNRTEFMPFAPVITEESAIDYFIDYKSDHIASEFMTITYDVYPDKQKEIEAVVHVDGTARPQVIKRDKNPLYYEILKSHEELTGIPVTVNTSFNSHEEPILCTIENAINSYNNDVVDVLVLNEFVVK